MLSKGTGIVCEYNPFHKGHAYQIRKVKEMGAEFVVCAMSGDFTQRAESAFQDKKTRANNAIMNGADIVLEIPFPFSSLSAEGFARAGVSILENSGLCDSFAFGSECADVEKLQSLAKILTPAFHKEVISLQKENPSLSYAKAREMLIERKLSREYADIITNPNDILATEYLKANKTLRPIAISRKTPRGGFDENFVSSSYIRKNLFGDENNETAKRGLAENCSLEGIYEKDELFYRSMLLGLMMKNPESLSDIAELQQGSEYSVVKNAREAHSYDELCSLLSSKTITDAKARRMVLFSFFSVTKDMAKSVPLYTEVLATSEKGRKMLKKFSDDRKMIVASRVADIKKDKDALCQYDFSRLASEVLRKCRGMTL